MRMTLSTPASSISFSLWERVHIRRSLEAGRESSSGVVFNVDHNGVAALTQVFQELLMAGMQAVEGADGQGDRTFGRLKTLKAFN